MVNAYNMKKVDMQLFLTGQCKHRHPYQQHPRCFEKEIGDDPKIGIFDIETAWGFNADAGFIICYVLKTYHQKKKYIAAITNKNVMDYKRDDEMTIDHEVVKKMVDDMKRFDVLVTYNGSRFDIPYSRTRALKHGYDFPKYGYVKHVDLYYLVKYKLKLSRNSLESACRMFGIKGKNHVDFDIWQRAAYGDEKAIAFIVDHCERDVEDCTEALYDKIIDYSRHSNRSI
jgi:uncharacterized protein YprB with RNaseH-like and TPR domain